MASATQQPAAAAAASRVNKSTIETAVTALFKYKGKQSSSQKPQLFPNDDYVYLNSPSRKSRQNRVPKKWNGVRSLHLKFYDSVALPIYQALPGVKFKIEGAKSEKGAELVKSSDNEAESKEMSGMKDGNSGKKKKTGRFMS